MKYGLLARIIGMGLCILCAVSCAGRPEPDIMFLPAVSEVSAVADLAGITLSAEVSGNASLVTECGFLVGKTGGDMDDVACRLDGSVFETHVVDFEYDTEYQVRAYVGNGRNVAYSEIHAFRTPSRPEPEPDNPTEPGEPEEPGGQNPDEPDSPDDPAAPEPEPEPVYTLGVDKAVIEASVGTGKYKISVLGNAEFEVVLPDDVDWVILDHVSYSDRSCNLKVTPNSSGVTRTCTLQFKSLNHDCVLTVTLIQAGYPVLVVDAPHVEYVVIGDLSSRVGCVSSLERFDSSEDWLYGESTWIYHNSILGIAMARNDSYASRAADFLVHGTTGSVLVHLVQHSYLDIIEFECPVMKQQCVEHWDANGDGELSYFEAEKARFEAENIWIDETFAFSRKDFTSFREMKYFTDITYIPKYLFAGSDIGTIEFNGYERGSLRYMSVEEGAFMNCTRLNCLYTHCFDVSEKAFMGCSSLEKICIAGPSVPANAFTGCTSLNTVVIERDDNDDLAVIGTEAFKGCTSLTEIDIPIGITQICDSAFAGCTSLRTVRLTSGTPPTLSPTAFCGTSADLRFVVPPPVLQVYRNSWPEFADQIIGE